MTPNSIAKTNDSDLFQDSRGSNPLEDIIELVILRKWWLLLALFVGITLATLYGYSITPLFKSSTLILVESQKIPTSYVNPTITSDIEERVNTIRQQILSRTNLQRIAQEFYLETNETEEISETNEFVTRIKAILSDLMQRYGMTAKSDQSSKSQQERQAELVELLRNRIEVDVTVNRSRNDSFKISYVGTLPDRVMNITNRLAYTFIEENLKLRDQLTQTTTSFIETQLQEAARELEKQEEALRAFKAEHKGSLPDQLNANLATLSRLENQLTSINESIDRSKISLNAEYSNLMMFKNLESLNSQTQTAQPDTTEPHQAETTDALTKLRQELAFLQSKFNDNYPDIVILKKRIALLTSQDLQSATDPSATTSDELPTIESLGIYKYLAEHPTVDANLTNLSATTPSSRTNTEIESLKTRRNQILDQIAEYEKRVEDTFANEQRLADLTRDYNISLENYHSLLEKKLSAKLSANLEKMQQGEQFRVLDPANFPLKPYYPSIPKVILYGAAASLLFAGGLFYISDKLSPSFRKAKDFNSVTNREVLITIPRNKMLQNNDIDKTYLDPGLLEQYRILSTNLTTLMNDGKKVFAVSSATENEGKTTMSLILASVISKEFSKKTILVDGDFKNPSIIRHTKMELAHGLEDILLGDGEVQLNGVHDSNHFGFTDENFTLLPILSPTENSFGLMNSPRMSTLLSTMKEQYDLILIDSPPILPVADMRVLATMVDGIILVVRAEKTKVNDFVMAENILNTSKYVGIILNGVRSEVQKYYYRSQQ